MIINRIQVLNYGCLRYVDVPMDRFHVLIGPNASGQSTLMDAIKFVLRRGAGWRGGGL